jgi:hypothetical protein
VFRDAFSFFWGSFHPPAHTKLIGGYHLLKSD